MGGWYLTITRLNVDTFFHAYFGSYDPHAPPFSAEKNTSDVDPSYQCKNLKPPK